MMRLAVILTVLATATNAVAAEKLYESLMRHALISS